MTHSDLNAWKLTTLSCYSASLFEEASISHCYPWSTKRIPMSSVCFCFKKEKKMMVLIILLGPMLAYPSTLLGKHSSQKKKRKNNSPAGSGWGASLPSIMFHRVPQRNTSFKAQWLGTKALTLPCSCLPATGIQGATMKLHKGRGKGWSITLRLASALLV